MIEYDNRKWCGLGVVFRVYGSSFPRALPYALISLAFSIYLSENRGALLIDNQVFFHPYAHQATHPKP